MGAEWTLVLGSHAPLHALYSALFAFAAAFGAAMLATVVAGRLARHHRADENRQAIKVSLGVLSMLVALVLGLMIADAKDTFDSEGATLRRMSAQVILLDRILEEYGPESAASRKLLHDAARHALLRLEGRIATDPGATIASRIDMGAFVTSIGNLPRADDLKRTLRERAIGLVGEIGQQRLELYVQQDQGMPRAVLLSLIGWITILFGGYGLLSPPSRVGVIALLASSAGIAAAVFLVEELGAPMDGLIRLSPAPLRDAVMLLGG